MKKVTIKADVVDLKSGMAGSCKIKAKDFDISEEALKLLEILEAMVLKEAVYEINSQNLADEDVDDQFTIEDTMLTKLTLRIKEV